MARARISHQACLLVLVLAGCTNKARDEKDEIDSGAKPAQPTLTATPAHGGGRGKGGGHGGMGHEGGGHRDGPDEEVDPALGAGVRRKQGSEVYLDGVLVGVVAYGELPPGLPVRWKTTDTGEKLRRYGFGEYLERIGVDLKKIREVHFYGGSRTARILGKDLKPFKASLQFSFTEEVTGRPRMHFPPGLEKNTTVDKLSHVAVYRDKEPPSWNPETRSLEIGGEPVEGVPYLENEIRGGVRVYVDGRLRATLKRNMLPSEGPLVVNGGAGEPRWRMKPLLASLGVETNEIKKADLIHQDLRLARIDAEDLAAAELSVVPKAGGEMMLHPLGARIQALLLYARAEPPKDEPAR